MRMLSRALTTGAIAVATSTVTVASALAAVPGGTSAGDPYFPGLGASGYRTLTYQLAMRYQPSTKAMSAAAAITVRPTKDLSSLDLDLRGPKVIAVKVAGVKAAFTQSGGELLITPKHTLRKGRAALVHVSYRGTMGRPVDDTGALCGFEAMPDGAVVVSEPNCAPTWIPVNDSPTDKARYEFTVTVPKNYAVVANGVPTRRTVTRGGWSTSVWGRTGPMASYLATVAIGDFAVTDKPAKGSTPRIINAVDRSLTGKAKTQSTAALAKQAAIISFFSGRFGRYPFGSAGAIVDADPDVGYALETQTRPYYAGLADESTVAHEIAHQWFGDSVSLTHWQDIWLNEGFATYAEWLWDSHSGATSFADEVAEARADLDAKGGAGWSLKIGDPGEKNLFDDAVYDRGALTLWELHQLIGAKNFNLLLRTWAAKHAYGSATTAQFIALAEKISGTQLDDFFTAWLYTAHTPYAS